MNIARADVAVRNWLPAHPAVATLLGIVCAVLGAVLIARAVSLSVPFLAGVGIGFASVGLWLIDRRLAPACERHKIICLLAGVALLVAGIMIVMSAFNRESASLAALGMGFNAFGLLLVSREVTLAGGRRPVLWVGAGLVASAMGIDLVLAFDLPSVLGVVLLLLGLLSYRAGIRSLCVRSADATIWCTRLGLCSAVLGLNLVLTGTFGPSIALVAWGFLLLVVGLTPLTTGLLRPGYSPASPRWIATLGAAILISGFVFWPDARPTWLRLIATVLLGTIALGFSWRGEGLVAVTLAGLAVVWVLVERVDEAPLDPHPEAAERILAIGDSYISGEGSTAFFPGTNVVGEEQNQCRRSSTAYPYLVASRLGMGLDFYACSGATAIDIHGKGQMGSESPDDIVGGLPQLDNLGDDLSNIRLVLISIGGNDAQFGDIGIACVVPGACDAFREHWLVNVARKGPEITKAFEAIKSAVEPSTTIVAIPYPLLLNEGGCGWSSLEPSEHDFLSEFVTVLDDRVRRSADQAGIYFFEPGLFAFNGAKICDGDPDDTVMNFFNVHPPQGGFGDRVNPRNWLHGTFHPKPAGHQGIALALTPWLEDLLEDIRSGSKPVNPPPDPDATFAVRGVSLLEPVLINPRSLPQTPLGCPVDKVTAFATVLPLIDAADPFSLNARPDEPVCYTTQDGVWTDDDGDVVTRAEGDVRIQPQLPDEGWNQRFIYRSADDGTWQLRIVEFCSKKPGCPTDPMEWMSDELQRTAQSAVLPATFIFVGWWMLGLGLRGACASWRRRVDDQLPSAERSPIQAAND